jgi:hypothetical protein
MDDNSENVALEGRTAHQRGGSYLWASPWVLIIGFCIWHFAAPIVAHYKAQRDWRRDRQTLMKAYSKMDDANRQDDFNSYLLAADKASFTLSDLEADLGKLGGTADQGRRLRFLQGSKDCIEALPFNLTPPKPKPNGDCVNLIESDKP